MSKTRTWSMFTALGVVVILLAGWFLLVSPKRSEAAELRAQEVSVQEANERLRLQIETLKVQAEDLPAMQAKLADIKLQLPEDASLPALVRDLTKASVRAGIFLKHVAPGTPALLAPAAASPPAAPSPAAPEAGAEDPAAGEAAGGAAAAPAAPAPSLVSIPVSLTLTGTYAELELFLNELHELKRAFLVNSFTLTQPKPEEDNRILDLTINGTVFVVPPAAPAPTAAAQPAAPGVAPAAPAAAAPAATPSPVPTPAASGTATATPAPTN